MMNSILKLCKTTMIVFATFLCFGCSNKLVNPKKEKKIIDVANGPKESMKSVDSTTSKIKRGELTLIFTDKTKGFDAKHKQQLIDVFFTSYPVLMREFNPDATKTVYFEIDPAYTGPAGANASLGLVSFGENYMNNNKRDLDIVIHETMHIIQNYPIGPGWVTEGIADYVRHTYGLNNLAVGWALKTPNHGESYTNGYGSSARLFVWLEKHVQKDIVKKLNLAMRKGTYTNQFWIDETGKDIDQLWADYVVNPAI